MILKTGKIKADGDSQLYQSISIIHWREQNLLFLCSLLLYIYIHLLSILARRRQACAFGGKRVYGSINVLFHKLKIIE